MVVLGFSGAYGSFYEYIGSGFGVDWTSDYTVSQTADLVVQDWDQHYNCIGKTTIRPTPSDLPASSKAICVRTGPDDFHFMRLDEDGSWYHKPGIRAIMRYKYLPTNSRIWTNEGYTRQGYHPPSVMYNSDIYYIIMGYSHYETSSGYRYIGIQNGVQKHAQYCVLCDENYAGSACTFGTNNRCTICNTLKKTIIINGTAPSDFTLQ